MELLAAWLLYPVALGLVCLGLGLLAERAAGRELPGLLLLPVGFAGVIALARVITQEEATAELALPAVGVLAVAGCALSRARLRALRPDPWLTAGALALFAVFAAPVVLTGEPTFLGSLSLPDSSHNLALADQFAERGPDYGSIPFSSYQSSVNAYIATAYPVGGQAALGVTAPLGVLDLMWLYQPFLTMCVLMLGLSLGAIVAPLLQARWQTALVIFVAAQTSLLMGYASQGNIKELAAMAMLGAVGGLSAWAIRERVPGRALLPIAVAAAAAFAALGPAALAYLGVLGVGLAVLWAVARRRERGPLLRDGLWVGAGLALFALLSSPMLRTLGTALDVNSATLEGGGGGGGGTGGGATAEDLGNLASPLETFQALGPYLSGDFRYPPETFETLNSVFMVVAGVLAVTGLGWLVWRRHAAALLLPVGMVVTSVVLLDRGTAYADGKVLVMVSPAILLLGITGAVVLWRGRLRPLAGVLALVLTGSIVASSAVVYHDVSPAPYDRYEELLSYDERYAGKGPVLFTDYDEFGKYLLRRSTPFNQPEVPLGYRNEPYEPNALLDPDRKVALKTPVDPDDLELAYLSRVNYLIMRRSPWASRPPSTFVLERQGRYYEVWRRTPTRRVLAHRVMGPDAFRPSAVLTRRAGERMARIARERGGRLAFVRRDRAVQMLPAIMSISQTWEVFGGYRGAVVTSGPGRVTSYVDIPRDGTYRVWLEGSFNDRRGRLLLDGRQVAQVPEGASLGNPGANEALADVTLSRGLYGIEYVQGGGSLRPGNGGYRSSLRHIGPITFQPVGDMRRRVEQLPADRWRELVGRRLDWVEVVR